MCEDLYIFSGAETIRIQFRETQPQRRGPIFFTYTLTDYSALEALSEQSGSVF